MKKIIVACLLGISVLSFIVAKQFLFKAEVNSENLGPTLAEVRNVKNELRYKHATGFFWADAAQSQKLYNGSEVFTGPSSEALLEMRNKDVIHVPAETLLRISENVQAGTLALNLERGSLHVEGKGHGKPLSVRVGNSDLVLKADAPYGLFAKKDASGQLTLSMASGSVTLENGDQKKILGAGDALSIADPAASDKDDTDSGKQGEQDSAEGAGSGTSEVSAGGGGDIKIGPESEVKKAPALKMTEVVKEKLVLVEPAPKKVLYGQGLEFFRWKGGEGKKLTLQTSRTADFLTETRSEDVSEMKEAVIPKDLGAGEYYWRLVENTDGIPHFSDTRTFRIERLGSAKIGQPALTFKERGKWSLNVPVKDAKPGEKFHMQVGKNKGFDEIFDEYEGPEPLKSFLDVSGEYNIRVRKAYGNNLYSEWSDPAKVIVRPPLSAPLLSKTDEKIGTTGLSEMTLAWNPVPYAVDYLVQIAEGPKFSRILKNVVVANPPYELKHNESVPGYMRLVARSVEGEYSPPSEVYQIKGVIKGPSIEKKEVLPPIFDQPGSSPQFHLVWTHRDSAKKYRVELSRDPKMAGSQMLETENVEFFHNVSEEGWYYFRVWPVVDESKLFGLPTPILAVSYGKPAPLITPKLVTPKKSEVFLIPKGVPVSIKFSWTESPENEWYALEMARNPNFKDATEIRVEAMEYVLKKPIANGQWYFRVRGRNKYMASAWSETGVFYFGVSQ
ncbi:hypothetical protein [Bdellovibrio bacteriovorus]|uniref:hypothetical protein n=1 Tax=Bdellovibrio bacteriovorus TaxID=959 RepID=UPI003CFF8006